MSRKFPRQCWRKKCGGQLMYEQLSKFEYEGTCLLCARKVLIDEQT